jgi:hypothetical protein
LPLSIHGKRTNQKSARTWGTGGDIRANTLILRAIIESGLAVVGRIFSF